MNAERLVALGRCVELAVAPDGSGVVVTVQRLDRKGVRYVSDLWRVPLDGAPPLRLTWGDVSDRSPAFRADGTLYFLSDRPVADEPEDERVDQVWALAARGGEAHVVTDEPLGVSAFRVGGDRLVTLAAVLPGVAPAAQRETATERRKQGPSLLRYREMPARHWDTWLTAAAPHLVVRRADGSDRRDLTPDADREYRESPWDLAPDGSHARIARAFVDTDGVRSDVLERWDLATGTCVEEAWATAPRQGIVVIRCAPEPGAPDVAILERRDVPGAPRVHVRIRSAAGVRDLDDLYPHDVHVLDRGTVVIAGDRHGRAVLRRLALDGGAPDVWTPDGSHEAVAVRYGHPEVFGLRHRIVHPPEPFRWLPDGPPEILARLSGFDPAEAHVRVDELTVAGAEDHPVHAFVVTPEGPAGARPGLLWIHGGPIGAFQDGWHWRWNPLVAAAEGFAVCLPNPRGSTGYGWPFIDGIWGNTWGDACYRDLMAVTDAFAARADVDATRLVAMGGSFGGYMVNWIGGSTDRFRVLVSHAGVWHFSGFAGVTDSPGWWRLELAGAPWLDEAALNRWSPHRNAPRWRTPVLILHGDRDFRVPVGEALAMFDALRVHEVDVELAIFPDENHWIRKPRNIRAWYETWLEFVRRRMDTAPA